MEIVIPQMHSESYKKVTRIYFRACIPLFIRVSEASTIEWE